MPLGVGQDVGVDLALEEVVGRLHHVQGRRRLERRHLIRREVAHPDCPNLALLEQLAEYPRRLLDGHQGIRPVDVIHVDPIRLQPAERVLHFPPNSPG
jgi:hypothetical protein